MLRIIQAIPSAGGDGSKLKSYIDDILNLYLPEIQVYYSPNYSEKLLEALDNPQGEWF